MTLNHKQAYFVAYTLLDYLYDEAKSDPLRELLTDMNPFFFADYTPADPTIWNEWVTCATLIQPDGNLTDEAIFETLVSFLKYDEEEYGYKADQIIRDIQAPAYQERWDELLKKVSTYTDI